MRIMAGENGIGGLDRFIAAAINWTGLSEAEVRAKTEHEKELARLKRERAKERKVFLAKAEEMIEQHGVVVRSDLHGSQTTIVRRTPHSPFHSVLGPIDLFLEQKDVRNPQPEDNRLYVEHDVTIKGITQGEPGGEKTLFTVGWNSMEEGGEVQSRGPYNSYSARLAISTLEDWQIANAALDHIAAGLSASEVADRSSE